ncbi:uncharacterized protein LOC135923762 isoform X2 [Gordionus sp. m RMFG-2023]|uniref:uncharacterized protein LOC135923762 isoform X2 n=1 Tax=Gordionus sp. m RMFG-2023 TaxID=3053472 RepID=UPI0031FDDBD0
MRNVTIKIFTIMGDVLDEIEKLFTHFDSVESNNKINPYELCHNIKYLEDDVQKSTNKPESPTSDKDLEDIAKLCSKFDSKLNLKSSKNELKYWFVIMSHSYKLKGAALISRLQDYALSESKFTIFDPTISYLSTFETSIVIKEIENYSCDMNINYQMFLIILPDDKLSMFSTLKNTTSNTLILSQIVLESTVNTNFPLHNIVPALINKSRIEAYSNCLSDLKILYPRQLLNFCDGDSKSGVITTPHTPKYLCRSGTGEVRGNLLLKNSPVRLNYEKSSFLNWPTYYAGDEVKFSIKFNRAKTQFAVYNIHFSVENFKNSIRYEGTIQNYKPRKHGGIFTVTTPGRYCYKPVAFKMNEFILPVEENDFFVGSRALYQFSIIPMQQNYLRAIRICKN